MEFNIRAVKQADLIELVDVLASSFHPQTGLNQWLFPLLRLGIYEDFRQRLRSAHSPDYSCLVAVKSGESYSPVLGTVEVTLRPTQFLLISTNPHPYLSNLAVNEIYRRQGIAHHLLLACERIVAERGYHDLYLHVLENNQPAKQLYLKAGYRIQSAEPLWCSWLLKRPRRLLLHKTLPALPS
jgi:ribosomal protein S18 acetylase RimI-like enzyme